MESPADKYAVGLQTVEDVSEFQLDRFINKAFILVQSEVKHI